MAGISLIEKQTETKYTYYIPINLTNTAEKGQTLLKDHSLKIVIMT